MPVRLDPEERELRALFDMVGSFSGKRVLEIGCGDGRLTWHYAGQAAHVVGVDPDDESIAQAIADTPPELKQRVQFEACELDQFSWPQRFDLILLSWSL